MRDFDKWLASFRPSIADYKYYVDFKKVYSNVDCVKVELNILNSLIGSKDIEDDFKKLVEKYPDVLKCIPVLLAKRELDIRVMDGVEQLRYNFIEMNYPVEQYAVFMRKTGLFDLIGNHLINNLVDYVTGIETGLDSNARKNRGGHLMEDLVESYLIKAGLMRDVTYFKEMYIHEIQNKWDVDLSSVSNNGNSEKRFDFVVKGLKMIYGIETNFYAGGGSKLNETARSYKTIALETKDLSYFKFVWITDGQGWGSARNNLLETFDVMDNLYCISDLEDGVIERDLK